jgi:hypothetical protein
MKKMGILIFVVCVILSGMYGYDSIVYKPSFQLGLKNEPAEQKKGSRFKTTLVLKNTGMTAKEIDLAFQMLDQKDVAIDSQAKTITADPKQVVETDFEFTVPDDAKTGSFSVLATAKAKLSLLSKEKETVQTLKREFSVVDRIRRASVLSVKASGGGLKVGNTIKINVTLKNTGEADHEFVVSVSVKKPGGAADELAPKSVKLGVGDTGNAVFDYAIPREGEAGKYTVSAVAGTQLNDSGSVGGLKNENTGEFEIAGLSIEGKAVPKAEPSTLNYSEKTKISAEFNNTGETDHEFNCRLKLAAPDGSETVLFEGKIQLAAGGKEAKESEFKPEAAMQDGEYKVTAAMERNNGTQCDEEKASFTLTDKAPSVVTYVGVPATKTGEAGRITVAVRDDRQLKGVTLSYQGPGMTEMKTVDMKKIDGDDRQATYQAVTDPFDKPGTLKYYVEVTDSKGQISRSTESSNEIKEPVKETPK